jgi:polar amino acid transport system substrate-binding protein
MKTQVAGKLFLLVLSMGLQAHAAEPVKVCVDASNPPFMFAAAGMATGVYPALISEAFTMTETVTEISAKPWKRCISEIDSGTTGVGGIYKNEERQKKYDFSDPIYVERMAVYFNKSHAVDFSDIANLLGKRVGVVRGWSYGDDFDKAVKEGRITVEEVGSDSQNFEKLAIERVDAVLAIEEAGAMLLKSGKFPEVVKSAHYLFENPTFLAFNKSANQTDVLAKFNKAISDMKRSGKLSKIGSAELGK